ncbi:BrnT family toxin [Rhizobium sp. 2YAF20]
MDYGQERWISLGVIKNECFIVVHTKRKDVTRLIAGMGGRSG